MTLKDKIVCGAITLFISKNTLISKNEKTLLKMRFFDFASHVTQNALLLPE